MNTYDWSMVALIVGIAIFSGWRGFLWQVANLGSFAIGGILVLLYGSTAADTVPLAPPLNRIIAIVGLYAIGVLFVFVAAGVVRRTIRSLGLEGADHHLGFVFGALEGMLAAFALTYVLTTVVPTTGAQIATSRSATITRLVAAQFGPLVPRHYVTEVRELIGRMAQKRHEQWAAEQTVSPLTDRSDGFRWLPRVKASRL